MRRTGPKPRPLANRFWAKVAFSEGCWIWRGSRHVRGYGQVYLGSGKAPGRAHRVAWKLMNGPVPDGMDVLHRCDNPPCVRPSHLFTGTAADNLADMVAKGRASRLSIRRSQCRRGHPLTTDNLYVKDGKRECRTCRAARWQSFYKRRAA